MPATPGHNDLSEAKASLIGDIKHSEGQMNAVIDELKATADIDQRLLAMAASQFEIGYMLLVKAIANPERLVIKPPRDG